jgi:hypothetical protein
MKTLRRFHILHPFILSLYPALSAASRNMGDFDLSMVVRPLIVMLLLAALILAVCWVIFKQWDRAGLAASLFILMFFDYGYYQTLPPQVNIVGININRHWIFLALWLVLLVVLLSNWVWKRVTPHRITLFMNIFAGILLVLPLYGIVLFQYYTYKHPASALESPLPPITTTSSTEQLSKPDIYYIVLDGYAREDILRDLYHFDNSEFYNFLDSKGFYIASESHSNYNQTRLSLASALNLDYIDTMSEQSGDSSQAYFPIWDVIRNNRAMEFLDGIGYTTITFPTGYFYSENIKSDLNLSPPETLLTNYEILIAETSMARVPFDLLGKEIPYLGYFSHRQRILYQFEQLPEIATLEAPTFAFMHIIAPHPPFVFGPTGEVLTPSEAFQMGDATDYHGTADEYTRNYTNQVIFINQLVEKAITGILENSASPPIIILQSDHGPRLYLDFESMEKSCIKESSSNFNAFLMPDDKGQVLYPEITPVNTFRVVFDTYFNTNLGLLDDKVFFINWPDLFSFIDITDSIPPTCTIDGVIH